MENMDKFNQDINELRELKLQIHELRKIYDKINEPNIKKELKEIIIVADKIYKEFTVNTEKIRKIKNFTNYYIVTVQKILKRYCDFKEKNITGKECEKIYQQVHEFIPKIKYSFEKMYQSLFNDEITDIDAEIKILLKQLEN